MMRLPVLAGGLFRGHADSQREVRIRTCYLPRP